MFSSDSAPEMDLFSQELDILMPDGTTEPTSLADFDAFTYYAVRISINYASQIGASLVLLVVLVLLTRPERRNTPVFVLNMLSLFINGIRNILQCVYFSGPFYAYYAQFSGDFSRVPGSQFGASIAGIVLAWMLLVCIQTSLVLQARAVCVTLPSFQRAFMLALAGLIALVTVAFRFALMVTNARAVATLQTYDDYYWLAATNNYLTMASILFFSAVFVTKLGFALQQRRRLGIRQFGPMQILFIMGCQTLIIPAIFAILQSFTDVPELGSQMLTIVALFLPLSSMWAAATVSSDARLPGVDSKRRGASLGAHQPSSGGSTGSGHHRHPSKTVTTASSTMSTTAGDDHDVDMEKRPLYGLGRGKLHVTPAATESSGAFGSSNSNSNAAVTEARAGAASPLTPTRLQRLQEQAGPGGVRVQTTIGVSREPR